MSRVIKIITAALVFAAAGLIPSQANADPEVVVRVQRSGDAEAEVTLRDANGTEHHCRTEHGTCRMAGVPPGRFTVSAVSDGGVETDGRPVMIPPDGKVTLLVALR